MLGNEAFGDWSRIMLSTYMVLLCEDGQEPKVVIKHSGGGEQVKVSMTIACKSHTVHQILQAAMKLIQTEDKKRLDCDLFESIFNLVKDLRTSVRPAPPISGIPPPLGPRWPTCCVAWTR